MTTAIRLLTVEELAAVLKVSHTTVYRLVETRKIRFSRVGGSLRFRAEDVEDYIESRTVQPVV